MNKVSIIIPAYNAEPYIEQCIQSAMNQTLKSIELIILDDGSTDRTGVILDELAVGHDNVRIIHQDNKGLYRTREIGLSFTSGEYVGWIDADDFVEPTMYEVLYNTAIEHDSELVICDYSWIPRKPRTKEKWFQEYQGTVDVSFIEQNSQVWNKIVKRELLNRLGVGPLFTSCFDEIYIRVLMEAKNPVTIKQQLYKYRVGSGTMSSTYTDVAHYRSFVEASKELRKVIRPENLYWKDYFDFRVAYYLLMTMVVAANSGDKNAYEQSRDELLAMIPVYKKNQHYWKILKENYGWIKAVVLGSIIPKDYRLANLVCKLAFRLSGE